MSIKKCRPKPYEKKTYTNQDFIDEYKKLLEAWQIFFKHKDKVWETSFANDKKLMQMQYNNWYLEETNKELITIIQKLDPAYNLTKFFEEKETICVNHFPSTEYYVELKPKYYIMAAPDLWLDNIEEKFIEGSNILFQNLAESTSWKIKFFVPFEAKKYIRWQSHLKSNSNIKIIYFNNIAIEGFSWFRNSLFNIN